MQRTIKSVQRAPLIDDEDSCELGYSPAVNKISPIQYYLSEWHSSGTRVPLN